MHKRAKHIVEILKKNGYVAYYAGGWVRDFLLGIKSDDIDIATNATPDIVEKLFSHTVAIGKAFGIILVIIDKYQYEVATFRKDLGYRDFRRPVGVEYTTAVEDALRRDFTINGMFYDPITEQVIDYVNGKSDLEKGIIKAIGDPHKRIEEDRLRMLRAIRLSCKFDFKIEKKTEDAIIFHANELLPFVAVERIYQELSKMSEHLKKGLVKLFEFGILETIFPNLKDLNIETIKDRLIYLSSLPKELPTISKLFELFCNPSLEEKVNLCKYFKLSNKTIEFVTFYDYVEKSLERREAHIWAHIYAKSSSDLVLLSIASHLRERDLFLKEHAKRKETLLPYIERITKKNPLLRASHLEKVGIVPGPKMGKLLSLGENISIDEKIDDVEKLIKRLKKTSLWAE